jgi:hypothetical protein
MLPVFKNPDNENVLMCLKSYLRNNVSYLGFIIKF